MCFPRLRAALLSVVCLIVFLSGCATPYGTLGGSSEIQLTPYSYRVSFSPTGYISWDLAYKSALLRCAELTIQSGYRYFGVVAIKNYSSVSSFVLPGNSFAHGFYNAKTAYNPPRSFSISYWPLPVLTIRMLKEPIPGVTLDARVIWRGANNLRQVAHAGILFDGANEQPRNHFQYQPRGTGQNTG